MQQERFSKKHPFIRPFYPEEVQESFERRFPILIASGIGLILAGVVFQMMSSKLPVPSGYTADLYMPVFILIAAVGLCIILYAGIQKEKYDLEGYNRKNNKSRNNQKAAAKIGLWCVCIMMAAAAIFLAAGLGFDMWAKCWVVFPIGGILCGIAVLIIQGSTKDD